MYCALGEILLPGVKLIWFPDREPIPELLYPHVKLPNIMS
jgi:hypothetical protein